MPNNKVQNNVVSATKWSILSEIFAKLAAPITNMCLARLLTPSAFGVIASITIVTSFADLFTDAGFQKYIIQHEFNNEEELDKVTDVAFWTNFSMSVVIFAIVTSFRQPIAKAIGCPDASLAIVVASVSILCTSFSSTYIARFRRSLDFKPLFYVRCTTAAIPIVITIPLAIVLRSYWAMVIGTVAQQVANMLMLMLLTKWKIKFEYSFAVFKQMLSFSLWNVLEGFSIWFAGQINIIIVAGLLNEYYLGLFKTGMATINSYMSIITASLTPVLFSTLSRCQNDKDEYQTVYFKFMTIMSMVIIPMGVGIFLYRAFAVQVLLGPQWAEIANFVGMWAVASTITITFSNTACEVYRSYGKPKVSFVLQCIYLCIYVPAIYYSAKQSFSVLCVVACVIRLFPVALDIVVQRLLFSIRIEHIKPELLSVTAATLIMTTVSILLKSVDNSTVWNIFSILLCVIVYAVCVFLFKPLRNVVLSVKPVNDLLGNISLIRRKKDK